MARLLFLASPELHGTDVHAAQLALRLHGFRPGAIDGKYGPATAAACRRAQRHYGLNVDGIFGPKTAARLAEQAGPPVVTPHPGRQPPGDSALEWMLARLGEKEHPPESNRCPVTAEFRLIGPWCMEAVSLAFKHGAGFVLGDQSPAPWGYWDGRGFAYVPAFEAWAKTRGFWIGRTAPNRGDVVCFDWNGDALPDHVGIVEKYAGGGQFDTVEGNTAVGNDSNGGELMRRRRYISEVVGFARVTHKQP